MSAVPRTCKRRLNEGLKALRLPTMRSDVVEVADHARSESLSYEQFFLELNIPSYRLEASKKRSRAP